MFPIAAMCRVLRVSQSGFYAWRNRRPSARARRDALLTPQIAAFHARSDATYGAPRILEDLREVGLQVGVDLTVAGQVADIGLWDALEGFIAGVNAATAIADAFRACR